MFFMHHNYALAFLIDYTKTPPIMAQRNFFFGAPLEAEEKEVVYIEGSGGGVFLSARRATELSLAELTVFAASSPETDPELTEKLLRLSKGTLDELKKGVSTMKPRSISGALEEIGTFPVTPFDGDKYDSVLNFPSAFDGKILYVEVRKETRSMRFIEFNPNQIGSTQLFKVDNIDEKNYWGDDAALVATVSMHSTLLYVILMRINSRLYYNRKPSSAASTYSTPTRVWSLTSPTSTPDPSVAHPTPTKLTGKDAQKTLQIWDVINKSMMEIRLPNEYNLSAFDPWYDVHPKHAVAVHSLPGQRRLIFGAHYLLPSENTPDHPIAAVYSLDGTLIHKYKLSDVRKELLLHSFDGYFFVNKFIQVREHMLIELVKVPEHDSVVAILDSKSSKILHAQLLNGNLVNINTDGDFLTRNDTTFYIETSKMNGLGDIKLEKTIEVHLLPGELWYHEKAFIRTKDGRTIMIDPLELKAWSIDMELPNVISKPLEAGESLVFPRFEDELSQSDKWSDSSYAFEVWSDVFPPREVLKELKGEE